MSEEHWRRVSTGYGSLRKWGPWHLIVGQPSWSATAACGAGISRFTPGAEQNQWNERPTDGRLCPKCRRAAAVAVTEESAP